MASPATKRSRCAYEELNVDMMMSKPFDLDELEQAMAVLNKKAPVLAEA